MIPVVFTACWLIDRLAESIGRDTGRQRQVTKGGRTKKNKQILHEREKEVTVPVGKPWVRRE